MIEDALIGRQLANYHIERLLGRGGMASVYYATDLRLHRPAAIKVIDPHFRDKGTYAARFLQEARSVAAWRHEHVIQIYYAGEEDEIAYFAMEYIDGTTLAQILADQASQGTLLPPVEVLRYGRAIASALDYAHRKGVIHRDVKPLNVLVTNDGRIVLADFGLALDTSQGSLGEVVGTAHYTAPEQARRSNAALPQSDLYSLGVILYEMLTGVVPFDDPSPTSVALQQIILDPPPPCQINPNLSPTVEAVLLRVLSKDPAARYQTGAALMDALAVALQPQTAGVPAELPVTPPLISNQALRPLPPSPAPLTPTPVPASFSAPKPARNWLPLLSLAVIVCLVLTAIGGLAASQIAGKLATQNPTATLLLVNVPSSVPPTVTSKAQANRPAPADPVVLASPAPQPEVSPLAAEILAATATQPIASEPTVAAVAPSPTLKYSDRRHFVMSWNETGFYMLQTSGLGDLIGGVHFERLDANLEPLGEFNSTRWADYSASSRLGWCFRLEINGADNFQRPPECGGLYLTSLHPLPGDPAIFWTPQEGSLYFRVRWHDEELVRCEISAGRCEVNLP